MLQYGTDTGHNPGDDDDGNEYFESSLGNQGCQFRVRCQTKKTDDKFNHSLCKVMKRHLKSHPKMKAKVSNNLLLSQI